MLAIASKEMNDATETEMKAYCKGADMKMFIAGLMIISVILLIEIFGYSHMTYEAITGEQYSEIKVITKSVKEDIETWNERLSSGSTTGVQAQ